MSRCIVFGTEAVTVNGGWNWLRMASNKGVLCAGVNISVTQKESQLTAQMTLFF
jgi:hypothetical protein